MGARWQLQEAKNRLSEWVRQARENGPQTITVHGADAVVVVYAEQFRKLSPRKGSFREFFRRSPLVGTEIDLTRSRDSGRPVLLELFARYLRHFRARQARAAAVERLPRPQA